MSVVCCFRNHRICQHLQSQKYSQSFCNQNGIYQKFINNKVIAKENKIPGLNDGKERKSVCSGVPVDQIFKCPFNPSIISIRGLHVVHQIIKPSMPAVNSDSKKMLSVTHRRIANYSGGKLSTGTANSVKGINQTVAKNITENANDEKLVASSMKSAVTSRIIQNGSNQSASNSEIGEDWQNRLALHRKHRTNGVGIQMLSKSLYEHVFKHFADDAGNRNSLRNMQAVVEHLKNHKLLGKNTALLADLDFPLPALKGDNLDDHFRIIADEQCSLYKSLLHQFILVGLPPMPRKWKMTPGWTRYNADGSAIGVTVPSCQCLVFDVEVCVPDGPQPTLAVAASENYWYSWCSDRLIRSDRQFGSNMTRSDLIPLESYNAQPKIVVGHNVSYDRLRVREEYQLSQSSIQFLDTMSLHIAVSGLIHEQRNKPSEGNEELHLKTHPWLEVGCFNSLKDVYKFYCNGNDLHKDTRQTFVEGTMEDIRSDIQNLMSYCAADVNATFMVLRELLPQFLERCPHPVTLAGMLEMGTTFLPVSSNWNRFIKSSEAEYDIVRERLNKELVKLAQSALEFVHNDEYKKDLWLWNLDWSLPKTKQSPKLPYWYRKLCAPIPHKDREQIPHPHDMSTGRKVVPSILRLTWNGYPLHHERAYGWGYLKPLRESFDELSTEELESYFQEGEGNIFPVKFFYDLCASNKRKKEIGLPLDNTIISDVSDHEVDNFDSDMTEWYVNKKNNLNMTRLQHMSQLPVEKVTHIDIGIPGVTFVRLPHKDGADKNVGNPMAKDFLSKIEDGTLSSYSGDIATLFLKPTKSLSYWRNNRDRIRSQAVIWTDDDNIVDHLPNHRHGIILPQVVTAGTITRRAVEPTWMTASNAYNDRIGSELKAMVEAPPGYHFVGADVDSQELWIAAVLGDAFFGGCHGCTALGWMTLQGNKEEGSDMHSRTAATAGISREHAKVINYGRIYGAGQKFVQRLLQQFNPLLSESESRDRAMKLLASTKGKREWSLNETGKQVAIAVNFKHRFNALALWQVNSLIIQAAKKLQKTFCLEDLVMSSKIWVGGSESPMFNSLEAIARSSEPRTPMLNARITRALEPSVVDAQFMTSRINWVVQSSAVDYLHTMLVCMRWLMETYHIRGRFCISIHDEVRYLVHSEDRYRAALALQITNLFTRSLFSIKLGMYDLPQSVAFFSSVDIDKVLRKEPHLDCMTPSNPKGLHEGYGIPPGESLTIEDILKITGGSLAKKL